MREQRSVIIIVYMAVSTSFVTTASAETLNGTILGVICPLPSLSPQVTPNIVQYRLAQKKLTIQFHCTNEVETPISMIVGIHYRGVQSEGGAVDWGSIINIINSL